MNFERNRDIKKTLTLGREPAAFKVEEVKIRVFPIQYDPVNPEWRESPSLGRYFHDWTKNPEYTVKAPAAYKIVKWILEKKKTKLKEAFKRITDEHPSYIQIAVALMFKGHPGEDPNKKPKTLGVSNGVYFFSDLAGLDVKIGDKMLHIPEGRLIPGSDFQLHLEGTR